MANNGGRQGNAGGGGGQAMNEHVEFTVKVSDTGLQDRNFDLARA